jgi:WD40 repeat protein
MAQQFLVGDETSKAPPDLELPEVPLTLDFHPTLDFVATGLIDGNVRVSRFSAQAHEAPFVNARPFQAGAGGCRSVRFSGDGELLFCASADHSIISLDSTGAPGWRQPDAHRDGVSTLCVLDTNLLASGDDSGAVKVWDMRQASAAGHALSWDVFQDYVSDLMYEPASHADSLLATSGDGTLACFDLRSSRKCLGRSEELEEDLLSCSVLKGGRKVVCGTSEGALLIFSWDNWDGATDSFPGHPESVGALLKLDEQTVLTGSSDGLIRVVGIQPSKLYGLVGDHDGFPLERMRWSGGDKSLLGSISHDSLVRFWDVSYLHEDDDDDDDDDDEEGGQVGGQGGSAAAAEGGVDGAVAGGDQTSPALLAHIRAQQMARKAACGGDDDDEDDEEENDDWEDLDDDDDDDEEDEGAGGGGGMSDEDDSDEDGGGGGGVGGRSGGGRKGQAAQFKTPAQSFFSDL